MGRASHSQSLHLWANGEHVGRWTVGARNISGMELQYEPAWIDSPRGRPISLSLPFGFDNAALRGAAVAHYFEGLLPDSDTIRARIAKRFATGSVDAFALLSAIGRDCVGALQLLPEGQTPSSLNASTGVEGDRLDDAALERQLLRAVSPMQFGSSDNVVEADADDDFRISLAGAQEKHAFLWWQGQWMKPRGATPTTHIFKLPLGLIGGMQADFRGSVDNEWLCLRILKAYGLPVANAEIATFGRQRVLVVERFDRVVSSDGRRLLRLMQEDFCQVTGKSPPLKYEAEGGPGLAELFTITRQSDNAQADMATLMAAQIVFWMLRAPDGHAKNFSIQLQAGPAGRFHLAPLYDVMSAWPIVGKAAGQWPEQSIKLAMALLGTQRHYNMHGIQRRHFNSTAKRVGYGPNAEALLQQLLAQTPQVIAQVGAALPKGFSQQVADTVLGGLGKSAAALENNAPT